jgi:hypothetical protein
MSINLSGENMKICKPKLNLKGNELKYQVKVESERGHDLLWYSFDKKYSNFISDLLDGPLIGLIIPAMEIGEDLIIEGSISEKLYFNLRSLQNLLEVIHPSLNQIDVYPENTVVKEKRALGVLTGVSCGIDSFSVLADYYLSSPQKGCKITHLVFNNVGSHGITGEKGFNQRFNKVNQVSERIGLPIIKVNSNLANYYHKFGFVQSHTIRNASVPLLLQNGFGRFLYASGLSYLSISVEKANSAMAYIDPVLLPLLSTSGIDLIATGHDYTRVQKTLQISKHPITFDYLDVCKKITKKINCSKCSKCLRTLLTLEIAGLIDRYLEVFDKDVYHKHRNEYIATIIDSDYSLHKEITQFANERGFIFPENCYNYKNFYKINTYIKRRLKNLEFKLRKLFT